MPKGGAPRSWVKKYGSAAANQKFEVVKQKMLSAPKSGRRRLTRRDIRLQIKTARAAIDRAINSNPTKSTLRRVVGHFLGHGGMIMKKGTGSTARSRAGYAASPAYYKEKEINEYQLPNPPSVPNFGQRMAMKRKAGLFTSTPKQQRKPKEANGSMV